MTPRFVLAAVCWLAVVSPVLAQQRPLATEDPETIGAGRLLIEGGVDAAAPPDVAAVLYEDVIRELRSHGLPVATGAFQAVMQVSLVNDGPVTLLLDSR